MLGTALAVSQVFAQASFPSRPVSMVVGFAPGGATDAVARIIAKSLAEDIKQNVVVENKAGAGGNIATDYVARAEADGYTILLGSVGSLTVAPHMNSKLPYAPLKDFAPVTMAVVFSNVLVVNPALPARNLADFIKLAKDKPGTLTYASPGIGGAGHLAGELLKMRSGIDITHVAYKGGGPAMLGMLGGEVDSFVATPVSVGPHIKSGKVRALATTGIKRDPMLPDVPTVAEQGYPGFETMNWYAYVVPAKTPKNVVDYLNKALVKVLSKPDVVEQLHKQGLAPSPSTTAELASYMQREYDTWGAVVKKVGIKVD
ncbi:MAG: tripartite tricarboxylate transporter substrate binding protein [Gammaproteobacteria bacterium]|nr:tripartite tricarboxylate transporter substrate binding protein [Gammaproteobacteria bacterium]MBU0787033.1 tripartite tricarboxylate transporter substrate binding protein [Gammaproteobacteria bacterium]MBU0816284.1 tripartite tricarboxylate transporter substrate binding protein [Gammaproteobacteria bacterium]MBU1787921.1 tripartite tricarboxylate transporter substrate binding protein [Gammaproteobacteria bacterium]